MMDLSFKRIVAYVLDTIIVTLLTTLLINTKVINPKLDDYNAHYEEYNSIVESFQNEEIDEEEYKDKVIAINYEISQDLVISNSITIGALIIYFGVVQWLMHGQTLGKKILNIKVVGNDDKKLNFGRLFLRMVILNNIIFRILLTVGVYFFHKGGYYQFSSILSFLESVIETIILIMVIVRKDSRGLHDLVAQTKVIDLKPMSNNVIENVEVKEIEEKKEEPKKEKKENKTKAKATNTKTKKGTKAKTTRKKSSANKKDNKE